MLKGYKNHDIDIIFKNYKTESEKYIVAENSSDLNLTCQIFKKLLKKFGGNLARGVKRKHF